MFEVGKLPDESMDSLLGELSKVSSFSNEDEGSEAERYFLNAVNLFNTVKFVRYNRQLTYDIYEGTMQTNGIAIDLVRSDSLLNRLDLQTCQRLLKKKYKLVISFAPFSKETRLLNGYSVPHLGPPSPAAISPWFKLFIYSSTTYGPPSMLLSKGSHLNSLPAVFDDYDYFLVTTWRHDAIVYDSSSALFSINKSLSRSALMVQGYVSENIGDEKLMVHIPFPIHLSEEGNTRGTPIKENPLLKHPAIQELTAVLDLNKMCGYISLIRLPAEGSGENDGQNLSPPSMEAPGVNPLCDSELAKWTLFDCHFGIPLFNRVLNREICHRLVSNRLFSSNK